MLNVLLYCIKTLYVPCWNIDNSVSMQEPPLSGGTIEAQAMRRTWNMPPNKFNLFFQPQNKFDPSIWTSPICKEKFTGRQGVYNEHVDQCRTIHYLGEVDAATATAAESASAVTTAAADSTQTGPTQSTSRVKDVPTIKEATKTTTQVIQNIM